MSLIDKNRGYLSKQELIRLERWEAMYLELVQYHKKYGHCLISTAKEYIALYNWVGSQRHRKKRGSISGQEEDLLNEIGFVWVLRKKKVKYKRGVRLPWEERFSLLIDFKQKYKSIDNEELFVTLKEENEVLFYWLKEQVLKHQRGRLVQEKKELLDTHFGDSWMQLSKPIPKGWVEHYEELRVFYRKYKHCHVTKVYKTRTNFVKWVWGQISDYNKGKLHWEKVRLLDQLNFSETAYHFLTHQEKWEFHYQELQDFYKKHGHSNLDYTENNNLKCWLENQKRKKRTLKKEYVAKLDKLNIDWRLHIKAKSPKEQSNWNKRYSDYADYVTKGTTDLISTKAPNKTKEKSLYWWRVRQRKLYKLGYGLTEEQVYKLKSIGIVDDLGEYNACEEGLSYEDKSDEEKREVKEKMKETLWNKKYQELVAFKEKHGHCYVSSNMKSYERLLSWMGRQRRSKKNKELPLKREKLLDELGFAWSADSPLNPFRKNVKK